MCVYVGLCAMPVCFDLTELWLWPTVTGKQMIAEIWMPLVSFHCALSAHTSIMLSVYVPDIDRVYVQHAWGYPLLCFNSLSTEAAGNVPSRLVWMRLFCMSPCCTEQNRNRSPLEAQPYVSLTLRYSAITRPPDRLHTPAMSFSSSRDWSACHNVGETYQPKAPSKCHREYPRCPGKLVAAYILVIFKDFHLLNGMRNLYRRRQRLWSLQASLLPVPVWESFLSGNKFSVTLVFILAL